MLLALGFVPSGILFFGINGDTIAAMSMILVALVTLLSYGLNRYGYNSAAGLLVVLLLTVVLYARAVATSTPESPRTLNSFVFVILFSGIFLSRRVTVFVGLLHIGLMFAYPSLAAGIEMGEFINSRLFYYATMLVFALLVSWFIDRRQQLHIQEVNASEQRYRELADREAHHARWFAEILSATPDHFVVFNRDQRIQYVNAPTPADLGFERDEMIGKTWAELGMHGPVARTFEHHLTQVFEGVESLTVDVADINTDQHYKLAFRPIHDADGVIVSAVATRREVTQYVYAQRELAASNQRYRIISELISDYAFAFVRDDDDTPQLEWITDSFQRVTGYSWEGLMATGDIFTLYHPEDRAGVLDVVRRVWQGEAVDSTARIVTFDGEVRWTNVRRLPERDPETGHIRRYYGVVQDITEQRKAERQRSRLEAERQYLGVIQDFVRAVSHDFRNSLANIETSRYLIHRHLVEPSGKPKMIEKSENMHNFVQHLSEQLNNLDTVFSLTHKDHHPLDIAHVLEMLVQQTRPAIEAQEITFIVDIAPDLPQISGNMQEMMQAVGHLLKNAIIYTPPGGTITLSAQRVKDLIVIQVVDTGPGVASEHLPLIFDLFYRADPARSMTAGGVGIGLSIVKLIMDAHGGSVSVDSPPGSGATFTLRLPVTHEQPHAE